MYVAMAGCLDYPDFKFRVEKIKCLSTVNCFSMPSVTVAVLTGLITIFRKNSVIFSPQNTVGDSCALPYVAMAGPTALITIFSNRKSVWSAVEVAHCPMYVAVAALITLTSSLE